MKIEERLAKCLGHVGIMVDGSELDKSECFIEDSITFITLIVELEQEFGIEVPDEYLNMERMTDLLTIREMVISQVNKKKESKEAQVIADKETDYEKAKRGKKSQKVKKTRKKDA